MCITGRGTRESYYPAQYPRGGVWCQSKHKLPDQVLLSSYIVIAWYLIELLQQLVQELRNTNEIRNGISRDDDILLLQLHYLRIASQLLTVYIMQIAKLSCSFNA